MLFEVLYDIVFYGVLCCDAMWYVSVSYNGVYYSVKRYFIMNCVVQYGVV